jgi:hypothetical protein
MTDRCIHPDYEIDGVEYEVWYFGDGNWALYRGDEPVDEKTLTDKQIQKVGDFVHDWLSGPD